MPNKLKYTVINRSLAVLMLLVLTGIQFIAIFHHHTPTNRYTPKGVSVKHAVITSLEKSCKICDLLSDSYNQVYHLPADSAFFLTGFEQTIYFQPFTFKVDAEILGFSNKGPPLV
jgi:hypothetical protein